MSDVNELLIAPLQKFAKDSMHLIKKCTKPDRKGEFWFVPYGTDQCSVTVDQITWRLTYPESSDAQARTLLRPS